MQRRAEPAGLSLEDVAALVDRRTKVVCVSHVQYATGHRLDPARLAALAHEHDAVLVLDASQSAGAVPIDVRADDVDFLVATSYKWLCSSFGAAICYVRSGSWATFARRSSAGGAPKSRTRSTRWT